MERRDFQGARHEIYRGFGLPFGFIPLIGASAAVKDEPVHLVIAHPDGRKEVKHFDLSQVYEEYPQVWG